MNISQILWYLDLSGQCEKCIFVVSDETVIFFDRTCHIIIMTITEVKQGQIEINIPNSYLKIFFKTRKNLKVYLRYKKEKINKTI